MVAQQNIENSRLFLCRLTFRIWHQCHEAGEFDGAGDLALVLVAELRAGRGLYLKHARNKLAEHVRFLIVYVIDFILAGDARHMHVTWNMEHVSCKRIS